LTHGRGTGRLGIPKLSIYELGIHGLGIRRLTVRGHRTRTASRRPAQPDGTWRRPISFCAVPTVPGRRAGRNEAAHDRESIRVRLRRPAETGSGHHHPHVTSSSRAAASNRPAATGERAAISIIGLIPPDGTPNRRRARA
jgi:hypothetical protein